MAGIAGVDPGPLTLRELMWMVDGRREEAWSHTAALMSLQANIHRDRKKRNSPFSPADFHPYLKPEPPPQVDVSILKDVFVKQ